ncbi:MAG: EAL domain-containing protein [Lachnospiraceae bacterium]|nr:EAL domain-containing protein [Lachnospiraceae bacterium]
MNFQSIADSLTVMTCVVSVEQFRDGKRGKFRIVTGNKAYIDSIEHPAPGTKMLTDKFVPNSEYTDYLTRDLNFEDYCYRAAVEKKCLHSYAHPERMDVWFNMMFIPLSEETEQLSYCLYLMEINFEADSANMTDISSDVASSVLDTCIRLRGTNDFKATMKDVIRGIRDLCHAEHCCVLVMNEYDRSCYVLGEAFSENTPLLPMETYVDNEFYDIAETWMSTIAGSSCLIAKNEQDMEIVKERNPVWYESLTSAGAHNIVLFPLKSRNQLLGYMWAINYDPELATKIKETLEITTFILGSELGNYLLLDRLRLLSSKDLLTGIMNRNEMNNYVDSLCHANGNERRSVGVIFADLNGLKAINDQDGHNAGDSLLKNAANALREVFRETEIFRAGGDEFAVIVTDITEEELEKKIEKIRKVSARYPDVIFALGGCVEKDSRNVRMALRRADERMYEDKRQFYEKNPGMADGGRNRHSRGEEVDEKFRERSYLREMNYDHLTGLPSMTYFFKLAEIGRKSMHEHDIPSAVVFINMSGLRHYNKRYGFAEGDMLIKGLAGLVTDAFGEENCSRFGQDHFAAFTAAEGLEKKLDRLIKDAKTINGGRSLPVRAGVYLDSMGLIETSLACDRAKYAGDLKKDDSSSCVQFFDNRMLSEELNRQYIIENLDRAINENWIKAFYQPIVRAAGRRVCDEEALARWIDPVKGMLSPADFIPILEDTRLIYKMDLHILELILERIKKQKEMGMYVVPVSINLSRTDFEVCDIVREIDNRVTEAGISKEFITIEITESVVGQDFDFMKEQIARFQQLGFKVWMDDFGSGYSSLDALQEVQFDLLKFDMRFMRQFESSPRSRILLTELMRMAQSLGIETVCEGVETAEQADFLSEIGCTKLQGYYFCKPIPVEKIWERYEKGEQIGFENPAELEYYTVLGMVNMYDVRSVSNEETETARHYFDTIPMAIFEFGNGNMRLIRCNKSYREFMSRFFGTSEAGSSGPVEELRKVAGGEFIDAMETCRKENHRVFINERMADGSNIHSMVNKIADDPVSGVSAFAVAVLDITPEREQQLTYINVAQALSADYISLYYVDVETERFAEYSHGENEKGITAERHGENFFAECHKDIGTFIYEGDREKVREAFTKEKVLEAIESHGVFALTYRLMMGEAPTFVSMKAVRMNTDEKHIIIGINNVDAQMRQQETIERLREEQTTYLRISALMGDFIAIYTVDPESGNYMQYSAAKEYSDLATSRAGLDFFADSIKESQPLIHPDDMEYFMSVFTREQILEKTKNGGIYIIHYRLMIHNEPVQITLRAGLITEKDGPQLIVGVSRRTGEE